MRDGRVNGDEQVERFKYGERIGEVFDSGAARVEIKFMREGFAVALAVSLLQRKPSRVWQGKQGRQRIEMD
jgi:hypothetical protein